MGHQWFFRCRLPKSTVSNKFPSFRSRPQGNSSSRSFALRRASIQIVTGACHCRGKYTIDSVQVVSHVFGGNTNNAILFCFYVNCQWNRFLIVKGTRKCRFLFFPWGRDHRYYFYDYDDTNPYNMTTSRQMGDESILFCLFSRSVFANGSRRVPKGKETFCDGSQSFYDLYHFRFLQGSSKFSTFLNRGNL